MNPDKELEAAAERQYPIRDRGWDVAQVHLQEAFIAGAAFGADRKQREILEMLRHCGHEAPHVVRFAVQDVADWLEALLKEKTGS